MPYTELVKLGILQGIIDLQPFEEWQIQGSGNILMGKAKEIQNICGYTVVGFPSFPNL